VIVPPFVPSRSSRVRLHVTRVHRQRDERWDKHRACVPDTYRPGTVSEGR
jgi:hypothetical protein